MKRTRRVVQSRTNAQKLGAAGYTGAANVEDKGRIEGASEPTVSFPAFIKIVLPNTNAGSKGLKLSDFAAVRRERSISVPSRLLLDMNRLSQVLLERTTEDIADAMYSRPSWDCVICGARTPSNNSTGHRGDMGPGNADYTVHVIFFCPDKAKKCYRDGRKRCFTPGAGCASVLCFLFCVFGKLQDRIQTLRAVQTDRVLL